MKDFMSFVAAWFAQEFFVQSLYFLVHMRFSQCHSFVLCVQSASTERFQVYKVSYACRLCWLTATVDTAAWASHNFDKVILSVAVFDFCKDFFSICKAGNCCNSDCFASQC